VFESFKNRFESGLTIFARSGSIITLFFQRKILIISTLSEKTAKNKAATFGCLALKLNSFCW